MLTNQLNDNGCNAMYCRPIFILVNLLTRSTNKDLTSISPRLSSTSTNSSKSKKSFSVKKMVLGLLGYPYALMTYISMKLYFGRGKILVCDRYFYQFFFDLYGNWSNVIVNLFPKPDITFFIDGDLDVFYSRMDDPFDMNVKSDYYAQVLALFRKTSNEYNFIQIDANSSKERMNEIIYSHLVRDGVCI